ncbi:unnamed protein product [Clonostachys solani]|uniref:Uncharacterized protein n=1 Tax=Clonostachys solani TaxID=160281 RepID=A0A9N9Z4P9_9HYPO|nr:unnamed protein product [Clonostachys solani]
MEANALMELGQGSRQDLNVTVRLQVWHYSERGRCPEFNAELARRFSREALGHWTAYPAEVVEPDDISIRDEYVPVEVDFVHGVATYNEPQGNPESGVRDVFKKVAPPVIYDYFVSELQSPPHSMNIYAVADGEEMAEMHIKMKYAHSFFFIPLELRLERFIKPVMVCQEDMIMKILHAGVNSLPILGSLIFAYMASQGANIPKGTDLLATARNSLSQLSSNLPWLEDMLKNVENGVSENTPTSRGPLVLLGNASDSFQKLRELIGELKPRLEIVSSGRSLTNQGIVRTILDLRQATIHLSEYEQAMVSFNNEEIGKWNEKASHHQRLFYSAGIATVGFAGIPALAFWNPNLADLLANTLAQSVELDPVAVTAQTVGVTGATSSGLATIYQYREKSKARQALGEAQKRASTGQDALVDIFEALRKTQAILALVYIVQVMRQPIACMGEEELTRAVKMLGGDLRYLDRATYNHNLVQDRLDALLQACIKLDTEYQKTMRTMNVAMDTVGRVVETT